MPQMRELAWVYSLDDLRYAHEDRRATALRSGAHRNEVVFGRRVDPSRGVAVSMTRDDHPAPDQVSAVAGRAYVANYGRSVLLENLSTNHSLYVRKWPSAQIVHTLQPALSRSDEHPHHAGNRASIGTSPVILGEGIWWAWTSLDPTRTPGWVLIDVLKPPAPARRIATPPLSAQDKPTTGTDPDRTLRTLPRQITLDECHVDFLVLTFAQYFSIPPQVRPIQVHASNVVDATKATQYSQAIIRAARPGITKGFAKLYNSELLPFLFEGEGGLSFTMVQEALLRLGLLE